MELDFDQWRDLGGILHRVPCGISKIEPHGKSITLYLMLQTSQLPLLTPATPTLVVVRQDATPHAEVSLC